MASTQLDEVMRFSRCGGGCVDLEKYIDFNAVILALDRSLISMRFTEFKIVAGVKK
jgi:hypothetical protein